MILNQSIWPIIGSVFHPTYMMVNVLLLGRIVKPDDKLCPASLTEAEKLQNIDCSTSIEYLAAFGLGSAVVGMVVFAVGFCYCAGL